METLEEKVASEFAITPDDLLAAIRATDRARHLPEEFREVEKRDEPVLWADMGITVPPPRLVKLVLEIAELTRFDRVLEIGTGSGYLTSVLAKLVQEVYSMDVLQVQAFVADKVPDNVYLYRRNGILGLPEIEDGFDAIIVQCGAPGYPYTWANQLKEGGRLVMPKGDCRHQALVKYLKRDSRMHDMGDFAYLRYTMMEMCKRDCEALVR
jgi:protein-L-isoaspartate(D-aspartate) O-methyltransferase